jgi:hypothetical protein
MSGDIGIGRLLTGQAHRDAVHIAVAPVVAKTRLKPGQHVGLVSRDEVGPSKHPIGIVDPFLKQPVQAGERFYLFLYPGSITSLRHEWTHPAFVGAEFMEENESRKYIEQIAERLGYTYKRLMEAADAWVQYETYETDNTEAYKKITPAEWDKFWECYEDITGVKVKEKVPFFECSC